MKKILIDFLLTILFLFSASTVTSAYIIKNDATGGDCISIGIWDSQTATCTLTTDIFEIIRVDSNYVTLDGDGHAVTGGGIALSDRIGVTIKNLNISSAFTKNFAECPVACHGDECMPCAEGYKGGVKSPLSA